MAETITARAVVDLIRARYHAETHVTLEEVRDAAGFSASRSCDVISLGTWPSRGLTLRGFEVKVSRADWKRELEQPHKAEAFAPYCDEWYIAAGSSKIVQDDELPDTWGLLVAKGSRLDLVKPAKKNLNPEPIDRGFLVALLKRAKEQGPVKSAIEGAEARGYERGKRDVEREHQHQPIEGVRAQLTELADRVRRFESAAGIEIGEFEYANPEKLGRALYLLTHASMQPVRDRAAWMIKQLTGIADDLKKLADMPDIDAGQPAERSA